MRLLRISGGSRPRIRSDLRRHSIFDLARRSEMISPAIRDDVARIVTGRTASLLTRLASAPLACHGRDDASREDRDAPSARRASFEDGRGGNQRDRPPGGRGVVDGPADIEAACRRWLGWPLPPEMTDTALEEQLFTAVGKKAGPPTPRPSPIGRRFIASLKRKHVTLQILWDEYIERHPRATAIRASVSCTRLGRSALGHHAAEPRRRRQAVCRLCRRHGAGDHRPAERQDSAGADLCRACWAPRTSPMPRRAGPRRLATGSAPIPAPSRRSAACRTCWCRTTPKSP